MKRDASHNEQIERWAKFVKENPDKWKVKVKPLIDSQILMARRFYKNLMRTPEGKEKVKKLRRVG
jgi:uncharacterized protein (DUF2461 family)